MRTPILTAAFCLLATTSAPAQTVLRTIYGNAGDHFGASIARYADLDGDGLPELLVGSPNWSLGTGKVSVVSSKYIATGVGSPILWTVSHPLVAAAFGVTVATLGDVDGDGVSDFAVIAAGDSTQSDASEVDVVSGGLHAIIATYTFGFGSLVVDFGSVAAIPDQDGDGVTDLAIGVDGYSDSFASVYASGFLVVSTKKLIQHGSPLVIYDGVKSPLSDSEGARIAVADIDGDGHPDIITGAPRTNLNGVNFGGALRIYRGPTFTLWRSINGTGNQQLGISLDVSADLDGDGKIDILAGTPLDDAGGVERGQAIVYSGAKLQIGTPPFDSRHYLGTVDHGFAGLSVAATPDTNGDFLADAVVGAPGVSSFFSPNTGAGYLYSGKTGERMGSAFGAKQEGLGDAVAAAWAYDGTSHFDVALGAPSSDANGPDAGLVRIVGLFPAQPETYCTAKVNSLGCTPAIGFTGSPSKTSASSFLIKASSVLNNKNGLLFYGTQSASLPFQGGILCVKAPVKRTSVQSTGGNPPPSDCTGTMSFDFNAFLQANLDPALTVGTQVFAQYWSRDPNSPSTTSLSNALRFVINP